MTREKVQALKDKFKSCLKDGLISEDMQELIACWWICQMDIELNNQREEMQDLADYNAYKNDKA